METDKKSFTLGEIAELPRLTSQINKKYEYMITSRYICIREESEGKRGILLKVLGKTPRKYITMQGGKPFCKDDKYEGFNSDTYYSFRFPTMKELQTVLDILKKDPSLLKIFVINLFLVEINFTLKFQNLWQLVLIILRC